MDRNSIIGFVLIGITLIFFTVMTQKKKPEQARKNETVQTMPPAKDSASGQNATREKTPPKADTLSQTDTSQVPGLFARFTKGVDQTLTLQNDLVEIRVASKGGRIQFARLKKYKTFDKKPLVLFNDDESKFGYEFPYENKIVNSGDLYFDPVGKSAYVKGKDSATVIMKLPISDSQYIEHRYTLYGNDYMVRSSIRLVGFNKIITANTGYFDLKWSLETRYLERKVSKKNDRITGATTTVFYKYSGDSPDKLSETKDNKKDLPGKIKWVAFKQQFFTSVLVADNDFIRGLAENSSIEDSLHSKKLSATLSFPFDKTKTVQDYHLKFYFGPLHYKELKKYGLELERQVFLGKGLLRIINVGLIIPVFNVLSKFIGNYGIIILLLTIFIKILLLPLTYKSYLSTARMRILKPELDAIKAKVGNDMAKMQSEQMKLYRSAGVSPFGGCLPMLLQLPILIAMFRFFPASIELRQQSFLWAHDLSTYDSIWTFPNGFKIPGYGDHISLFTILMTISTLIYTKMNSDMMGGQETQKQMKILQYVMPIMFLGFFNNYSAGLSYYYFLANVLTFGQQYLFKLFINEDKLRKQIELNKAKKSGKPKSKWQLRLEELQKQQQRRR